MTCLVCGQQCENNYCFNCMEVLTNGLVYRFVDFNKTFFLIKKTSQKLK